MEEQQARERILELNKMIAEHFSENQKAIGAELYKSIIEYGKQSLNGLYLLNGSAAVAIMYNKAAIGSCWATLLLLCVLGASLAVVCSALSYFAQRLFYLNHIENSGKQIDVIIARTVETYFTGSSKIENHKWEGSRLGNALTRVTIVIAATSFCCFIYALLRLLSETPH